MKTGILLINLGTPDNPGPGAVGRYLTEFLSDGRVIDIPWLPRQILVRGIISPLRRFRSSREYKKVWTDEGSPLLLHGLELTRKVSERCTALAKQHPHAIDVAFFAGGGQRSVAIVRRIEVHGCSIVK